MAATVQFQHLLEAVNKYGRDTVLQMQSILLSKNKVATGTLIRSLKYDVVQDMNNLKVIFSSVEYGQYVDSGRRPGKYPPIRPLVAWAKLRGFKKPESAAFGIARNIYKFGIKPIPFIEPALSKMQPQFDTALSKALDQDITLILEESLKSI